MPDTLPIQHAETDAPSAGSATSDNFDEFAAMLQKEFRPRSEDAGRAVQHAIQTLAREALKEDSLIADDTLRTIDEMIAAIDERLTDQVNLILHHPDFQKLEGAWRGLDYLVRNSETDTQLKIRVMNIKKDELGDMLRRATGASWDQTPFFKQIYEQEFGQLGGEPYGVMVGDYYFDHHPQDVKLLAEIAKTAAAAHAPFISAAASSLLGIDSWQQLDDKRDVAKTFTTDDYAAWRSLRSSEDSRYIALTMPRFLARLPYGAKTDPVSAFHFEEAVDGTNHERYAWANAAYAMAVNINRSFKLYGWCTRIRGAEDGGSVPNLPLHTFPTDDGGIDSKCPTEIAISERREFELSRNGLSPLVHRKHADEAVFIGAQTLQKPAKFNRAFATENAELSARLPYIFACSRFAHYLKVLCREKIGSFKERDEMQRWLNDWIMDYVDGDPTHSSVVVKSQKPLAAAQVKVEEVEGSPGYYQATFWLRPHYQLEQLGVSLRLVSRLPAVQG
ncbi:type VI secretion system contractile sheath large subunit [Caballeronia sp. BR00000012568055]|uniref:type VI secretion system contractile sheath large subunit n=1 Tax=Caballeronia sp. BR00000012568055 TaxID=2918761 RepID=UPI0023F807D4|nr:type VI secretion system contractile sheath large subunit [Caballeronia sp. BR00000012568055]